MKTRATPLRAVLFRTVLFGATLGLAADASPRARPPNPFASAKPVSASESRFSGDVVERLRAGSYLYLRVRRDDGSTPWVVTAQAFAPDAGHVRVHVVRRVEHFDSPRLRRSFSPLNFAIVRKETP